MSLEMFLASTVAIYAPVILSQLPHLMRKKK